jgi:sortase A
VSIIILYSHQKGFAMNKKLLFIGLFCLLALLAFFQSPDIVLSRSIEGRTASQGNRDFAMPPRQVAPTPTPTTATSPLPTPTNTPIPAPTNLPPTGADLTLLHASAAVWSEPSLTTELQADLEQETGDTAQPSYLANGSLFYPVRLAVGAIGLETAVTPLGWRPVMEGDKEVNIWHMVDKIPGWHLNSVVPGQPGNTVISGHNNTGGSIFRNLHRLQAGDEITLWTNVGTAVTYAVEEVNIVPEKEASATQRAANAKAIAPTTDTRLTLVTCWPWNSNTHRVIVVARPIE